MVGRQSNANTGDLFLAQWCLRNNPSLTLGQFAKNNLSTVTADFQRLSGVVLEHDHGSILWTQFTSMGVDMVRVCQQLRSPLSGDQQECYHLLALDAWAYTLYLHVLAIDGASVYGILDFEVFQHAVSQPQKVAQFILKAGCNDELKGKAKRRFKGRAKLEQGDDKDEDNAGVDEMGMGMGGAMSIMQVESLLNLLNNLLSALLKVLQKVSLSQSDESQHTLASQTVTLIHLFFSQRPRELSKTLKVNLCFQVLGTYLTNPVQQTSLRQDSRLFKFLKPLVLMKNPTDGSVQPNLTQNVVKAAEQCVSFLKQVMTQKKTVCQCVFVLAQHMVLEVVDRVEYRYKTANLFVSLVVSLPEKMYSALLEWLFYKLTSTKQNERLFVLDILESLLNYVCNSGEHRGLDLNKETLVENVLERCSDKVPSIRAKALSCVSALCALKNSQVSGILQSKLTTMGDKKVVFDKSSVTVNEELIEDDEALDEAEETKDDFNLFFSKRCRDEKFIVRKAALKAYTDVVEGMREQFEKVDQSCLTAALTEAAVDVSLMIRKQSIDSISQLLNAFRMNQTFQHTWLSIVMPMFVDTLELFLF